MLYTICDDAGNELGWYDDEQDAREVLDEVIYQEPDWAGLLVLRADEVAEAQ